MRRTVMAVLSACALFLMIASSAFAASPHFIYANASLNHDGSLAVAFKEAGLGDNLLIHEVASATGTAVYACFTKSGNHPQASNKVGPTTLSASGDFPSGKNGQITGSLTIQPPAPTLSCPSGQVLKLASVSYTNVVVTDTTNGVSTSLPGTFEAVFYDLGPGNNA
ncbi:MAG TPA: hypothetical protein VE268_12030 [Herpetosiphonaceae bacterium]|nr:hypothetical protein [Herpetosiphonaceae bacterium]